MSNIDYILEERPVNIGNFMVGRLLPFTTKKMVGPFIFIDHAGPIALNDYQNVDVPPHPHIGLSTLTYLFEGSILHKDSLGNEIEIMPGQVNWMTAGKGVVHSERTPAHLRKSNKKFHGLQIWIALPKELEEMNPSFTQITEELLPKWNTDGISYELIAGEAFGRKSPVPVYSRLFLIKLESTGRRKVNISHELFGEVGIYILKGSISNEGNIFKEKYLIISNDNRLREFIIDSETIIFIFGGDPFPEERFIEWNFVATNRELIENAKEKWLKQSFTKIFGETEFVPLPVKN